MVVVITGPTAVGKTKLSVEVAKKINGEIINADSTQIFKELDIATAKVTKEEIKNDYSNYTNEKLYNKLLEINPKTEIHQNNRKRIERELDKYSNNSVNNEKTDKLLYDVIFIGLTTERENLYNRINNRVDQMLDNRLIEEAKKIYNTGIRTKAVLTPIGYKELFDYFDNKCTLDDSIELIKQRSRRYAKSQYTWNKHQFNLKWFDVNFDNFNNTINEVLEYIKEVSK